MIAFIEVNRNRLTPLVADITQVFLEPGGKGSASFAYVQLVAFATRDDVDDVVCLAIEVPVDGHGSFGSSDGGGRTDEGTSRAFRKVARGRAGGW